MPTNQGFRKYVTNSTGTFPIQFATGKIRIRVTKQATTVSLGIPKPKLRSTNEVSKNTLNRF